MLFKMVVLLRIVCKFRESPRMLGSEQEQTQEGGSSSRCLVKNSSDVDRPIPFRDVRSGI